MLARGAFLVLLCCNLAAALWWALHRPLPVPPLPAGEPGVPTLVLLAEAEREDSTPGDGRTATPIVL